MWCLQERYERHHQCLFDDNALPAAVSLSARYIPDRYLPDKAIDVMDEAASRVRIQTYEARRAAVVGRLHVLEWENLVQVLDAKDEAVQVCCRIASLTLTLSLYGTCELQATSMLFTCQVKALPAHTASKILVHGVSLTSDLQL